MTHAARSARGMLTCARAMRHVRWQAERIIIIVNWQFLCAATAAAYQDWSDLQRAPCPYRNAFKTRANSAACLSNECDAWCRFVQSFSDEISPSPLAFTTDVFSHVL